MPITIDPVTGELIEEEYPRRNEAMEAVTAEAPEEIEGPSEARPFKFTQQELRYDPGSGRYMRTPRARSGFAGGVTDVGPEVTGANEIPDELGILRQMPEDARNAFLRSDDLADQETLLGLQSMSRGIQDVERAGGQSAWARQERQRALDRANMRPESGGPVRDESYYAGQAHRRARPTAGAKMRAERQTLDAMGFDNMKYARLRRSDKGSDEYKQMRAERREMMQSPEFKEKMDQTFANEIGVMAKRRGDLSTKWSDIAGQVIKTAVPAIIGGFVSGGLLAGPLAGAGLAGGAVAGGAGGLTSGAVGGFATGQRGLDLLKTAGMGAGIGAIGGAAVRGFAGAGQATGMAGGQTAAAQSNAARLAADYGRAAAAGGYTPYAGASGMVLQGPSGSAFTLSPEVAQQAKASSLANAGFGGGAPTLTGDSGILGEVRDKVQSARELAASPGGQAVKSGARAGLEGAQQGIARGHELEQMAAQPNTMIQSAQAAGLGLGLQARRKNIFGTPDPNDPFYQQGVDLGGIQGDIY